MESELATALRAARTSSDEPVQADGPDDGACDERLAAALKGNSIVRKVHLNFNPAVTDAGAKALEAALPQSNVAAVWLDHTGVSETARARLHLLCITNALRLIATNDTCLTAISWNLVGQTDKELDTAPLVKACQAARDLQRSIDGDPVGTRVPPWHEESCDAAVTGALADALATNTNLQSISLMTYNELTPGAAAYLQAAFGRSSVHSKRVSYLPTEAREAREQAALEARKAEQATREKAERAKAEAEAAKKQTRGGRTAVPPTAKRPAGTAPHRVPSR